jgi:hypothetical protein
MQKTTAIELLGGSVGVAAAAVGITPSAVTQWPDELPPRLADRVQAALWRKSEAAKSRIAQSVDLRSQSRILQLEQLDGHIVRMRPGDRLEVVA